MNYIKIFEDFSLTNDIRDIFLELSDIGFEIYQYLPTKDKSDYYPFIEEFVIYKKGKSGYYINNHIIDLFNINDIIECIIRFYDLCKINSINCKILVHDAEFFLDITNKLDNLELVNNSDSVDSTHLHTKKVEGAIDLSNIKFCCCQILK